MPDKRKYAECRAEAEHDTAGEAIAVLASVGTRREQVGIR
jgi:hypothetical protein